jgi:RNA polymerase sigma-70 factor (ECF subfamily)
MKKDERILFAFYTANRSSVFKFIHKQIGNRETAEELTQDVFLDFIEGLRDFRRESSLRTYLFSIARFKIIDHIKKKKIKKILFSALPRYFVENIVSAFTDTEAERKDLAAQIETAIAKLPNDYRIIIRLKYMDGMKVKEIATRMAMSCKATESLLYRARQAFIREFRTAL